MSLTTKTMLVKLTIEMLGTSGKDNSTTVLVNNHLQTNQNAGYYKKCKLDNESIKDVKSTAEAARKIHKELTRPFGDDKWRLLPAVRVKEWTTEIRAAKRAFEYAVSDLNPRWPAIIATQKKRLTSINSMFDPNDYPFVKKDNNPDGYIIEPNVDLSKYYIFNEDMQAMPDKGHLILDIEADLIKEIKNQMAKNHEQKMRDSKLELWRRLIEPVENMANICINDKKVFASLTQNIEKELDILADLNVTNDIDLTNAINDVRKNLVGYTPGQIREDKRLKSDLGMKAKLLSDKMTINMSGAVAN